ncbi:(d)CMP kinase [Bacteroidota bacterium]
MLFRNPYLSCLRKITTDIASKVIIAIDGPAGSGKSSTARAVGRELGFLYLDTGAMYRAIGLAFRRSGSNTSRESISSLVDNTTISLDVTDAGYRVSLDGEDVTELIRTPEASESASVVAKLPAIRAAMVEKQRAIAASANQNFGGVVLEGRDIGTVVFPEAELKIFLDADISVRANRRGLDLADSGVNTDSIRDQIERRDTADQTRDIAPLKAAPDAIRIDTTDLTFDEQVSQIVGLARKLIH